MEYRPTSLLQRLVGGCFSLLAAAVAVYVAARLIESVWLVLIGIGVVVLAITGLITVFRWRRQGW